MKKMMALALALLMMLTGSLALADEFRMGIDPEYAPFSYLDDNGNYAGFDVEICKAVCDLLGWEQVIVPVNWDFKLISLDNNEHDCIWSGMTIMDTMAPAGYVLSTPYYDNSQVILTKEGSGINGAADLAGKRVAVQAGTSAQKLLEGDQLALAQTFEGGAPILFENYTICATEMDAGGVDAIVADLPKAAELKRKFNGFAIVGESLGSEVYGICFRKDGEALCKQVEDAIKTLVENGTYLEIAKKYEDIEIDALLLLK